MRWLALLCLGKMSLFAVPPSLPMLPVGKGALVVEKEILAENMSLKGGSVIVLQDVTDTEALKALQKLRKCNIEGCIEQSLYCDAKNPRYQVLVSAADKAAAANILCEKVCPIAFTPSYLGCEDRCSAIFFTGSFLYWRVQEDNLVYARQDVGGSLAPPSKNIIREQPFRYDPGFRAGAGYRIPYSGWDILADWTHIFSHTRASKSEGNFGIIAVLPSGDIPGSFASSSWKIQFNALDFEFGRESMLARRFSLRPFAGVKAALIEQHWHVKYEGYNYIPGGSVALTTPDEFKGKCEFKAIGPRIGSNARWHLGSQFGLTGSFAGALLYGDFDAKTRLFINLLGVSVPVIYDKNRMRPMLEAKIGLDWGRCFGDWFYMYFGAAYEAQLWWNQNMFPIPSDISPSGDLQMQGLTFDARFEF